MVDSSFPPEYFDTLGPPADWKYEMRRQAQEVLPSIYLGPYQSSRDLNTLQQLGITHICCISETREAHLLKPRFPDQFQYLTLDIRDATDQHLITIFPRFKEFIDIALAQNGKVLVHCGDGLSRSPALLTGYVMASYNLSSEVAFRLSNTYCQICYTPFLLLVNILAFEPICRARREMAQYMNASQDRPNARRKRPESEEPESRPWSRPAP
uniref:Dual specificity phosphatase n=1 Tax=Puccinia cf. psidii AE-2014 TaxID=1505670 RepID=A0A060II22_9BASI|nr:dual specificity phosphatase [Puccinia cf. psidii AE-2014]